MGTSSSAAEIGAKLSRFGLAMTQQKPLALNKTGLVGKGIFLDELRRKGVRGTTKVSKAVKARYDVKGDNATVRYTGPAHLLDRKTRGHAITPKGLSGTRKQRGRSALARKSGFGTASHLGASGKKGNKALLIPGVGHRDYAFHPGTKGLHFFPAAKKRSEKELPRVYQKAGVSEPLRKTFA